MSRRPYFPFRLAPVAHVWSSPARDTDAMLSEIREHAQRGRRVHVMHADGGAFEIVMNGSQFMVRALGVLGGSVVGTFGTIAAAVRAGDKHLDEWDEPALGHDDPKGAA